MNVRNICCKKHLAERKRLSQRAKETPRTGQGGGQSGNRPESAGVSRLSRVEPSGGHGAAAQLLEPAVSRVSAGRTGAAAGSAAPGCPAVPRALQAEEGVRPGGVLASACAASK